MAQNHGGHDHHVIDLRLAYLHGHMLFAANDARIDDAAASDPQPLNDTPVTGAFTPAPGDEA